MSLFKRIHYLFYGIDKDDLDKAAEAREPGEKFSQLAARLSRMLGGR